MQKQTPLISVIMPLYNAERFVGESIENVLRQTVGDFELIVIDDASTDASPRSHAPTPQRTTASY